MPGREDTLEASPDGGRCLSDGVMKPECEGMNAIHNSSANQCSFNIFAPPDGSLQKHTLIIWLRQWIVHFMIIN